ncbi:heavy-metal-associated domain-containing protein [Frigidibacter sp. MR17.24]|uniref:heavy-metal-associated domain-containing protein n=1 Tax=Frigidibacter sp. MR17.24 TaxID=3127345 RepID=UPI003012D9F5
MILHVPDMSCSHCHGVVEKTVASVDGGAKVVITPAARTVEIRTTAAPEAMLAALDEAGYPAEVTG